MRCTTKRLAFLSAGLSLVLALGAPTVYASAAPATSTGNPALDADEALAAGCTVRTAIVPPTGFDPALATATVLRDVGFPTKPVDPTLLHAWEHYVSLYKAGNAFAVTPCGQSVSSSAEAPNTAGIVNTAGDTHWAGYIGSGMTFTDVEAQWTVPAATGVPGSLSSHWVGIGQGTSQAHPLVQGGEESPANAPAYAWVETYYPGSGFIEQPVAGFSAIQNHALYVHIYFGANGTVASHFIDYWTGANSSPVPQHYGGMTPDGTAEWISENPNQNGEADMSNFGVASFTTAEAAASGWHSLGSLTTSSIEIHHYDSLVNQWHIEAYPSGIGSDHTSFTNYFNVSY